MKSRLFVILTLFLMFVGSSIHADVKYIHTDALGSVIAESDASGSMTEYLYNPYGKLETDLGPSHDDSPGYTGHLYDDDLGLTYMKARFYDPEIGRFYSNDPAGFTPDNLFSFNRYAYANNNPYKYVDPNGEHPLLVFALIGGLTSYLNAPDIGEQVSSGFTPEAEVVLTTVPVGNIALNAAKSLKNRDEIVDLYRAVSPDEYYDIMKTGQFRTAPNSLSAKQFGRNLDEVVKLTDSLPDTAAIVKTRIPRSTLNQLDQTPVDTSILRSGSVTAHEGPALDLLNKTKVGPIEHAF